MMKKPCLKMAFISFAIFIMLPLVHAVGIGASPGILYFSNLTRNGYAEDYLTLSTTSQLPLQIGFQVEGELKDWVQIAKPEQELVFGRPLDVNVTVTPPEEAQNGVHDGTIIIYALNEQTGEGVSTKILPGIAIAISVEVIGEQQQSCRLMSANIENVEVGYPLEINSVIDNTGNVNVKPDMVLDIWNKDETELIASKKITADNIRPTTEASLLKQINVSLNPGQYWADLQIPVCNEETTITFDVVEKGEITDRGSIVRMDAVPSGPTVPVDAYFKNSGSRTVSAKFLGKVYSGDTIVKVLETDYIDVGPNDLQKFEVYYQPEQPGNYKIEGKFMYNNKLTYSQDVNVEVTNQELNSITGAVTGKGMSTMKAPLVIIVVVLAIFILLIIRKKKEIGNKNAR